MRVAGRVLVVVLCGLGFFTTCPALAAESPEIRITPDLPSGWLTGGEYPITISVSSASRIEMLSVSAPTIVKRIPDLWLCLVDAPPGQCTTASMNYVVRPELLRDGIGALSVGVTNGAGEKQTWRYPLWIDHTAPPVVAGLALDGAPGWRSRNAFDVRWREPPADAGSPSTAVRYELCPAVGAGDCMSGRREHAGIERMAGLTVPGSGVWRLRVALQDEAGNVDMEGAAATTLMLDADPPSGELLPERDGDPAKVELRAVDAESGIAEATLEARRQSEDAWRVLNVANGGSVVGVLDDGVLPSGIYEIRGRAIDHAGNERTVSRLAGGELLTVRLPVRQGTRVRAGLGAKASKKLDARPLLAFGSTPVLRGVLADERGRGVAGAAISVSERSTVPGASWRQLTTLRTDAAGAFKYQARRGTARTLRFAFAGSPTTRPSGTEVTLRVRARTTIGANRRSLRNGDSVTLRGRLSDREIPAPGKLITLQARVPGGWRTFATARARAKDGRWSYRYRFTNTSRPTRYTFRALIPAEASYPYVKGISNRLTVVVRGSA